MDTRVLEIRDRITKINVLVSRPGSLENNSIERAIVAISGYSIGNRSVLLTKLSDNTTTHNACDWNDRTMLTAHRYIEEHFDKLKDGDVVDVEFILGETTEPKEPEWKNHLGGF